MKHPRTLRLALISVLALLVSPALAQEGDAKALQVVRGVIRQFEETISRRDAAAMAQLYTKDAQDLFEGYEYIGTEAIAGGYKGTFEYGVVETSMPVTEATFLGNMAYGMGTAVNKDAQGKVLYNANWLGIFKQEGGEWKVHRLIMASKPKPAGTTSDEGN